MSNTVGTHTVVIPPIPLWALLQLCFPSGFFPYKRKKNSWVPPWMYFLTSWLKKKCTHSSHYCSFLHFIKKPDRPFHNNLLAQSQFLLITIINLSVLRNLKRFPMYTSLFLFSISIYEYFIHISSLHYWCFSLFINFNILKNNFESLLIDNFHTCLLQAV